MLDKPHRVGLTLSGGGACCAAQIGVLKCLKEARIQPQIIAGTSGGAIVGALFANGIECLEILHIFKNAHLFYPSHFAFRKPGFFDIETYEILEEYFSTDDFSALKIPLIVNTTQLQTGTTAYFDKGPLIKPLLASAAFPGLFAPILINDQLHADGGIIENLLINPIRGKCDTLIAIDVNATPALPAHKLNSSIDIFSRALRLSMHHQQSRNRAACDILICPQAIADYGLFSTNSAEKLFDIGYREGKKMLPRIQARLKKQLSNAV